MVLEEPSVILPGNWFQGSSSPPWECFLNDHCAAPLLWHSAGLQVSPDPGTKSHRKWHEHAIHGAGKRGGCHYSNNLLQSLISISIAEPTLRGTPLDPVPSVWLRPWCCPQLLHQLDPELNDGLFPQVTEKKKLTGNKCFLQLKFYFHKMWCSTLSQTYLPPKPFMQIVRPQSPIMFTALGTETESSLNVDLLIHLEITMMNSLQSNKK